MKKLSFLSAAICLELGSSLFLYCTPVSAASTDTTVNTSATDETPTQTSGDEALSTKEASHNSIVVTARQQTLQAPGVSTISSEAIRKHPPARDVSEIIRTQPGVNLTGNSTSGQRGNNRQIDIRGMGPENTLILIDGRPVSSKNSVRYGWRGERDSRGDTNWVPPEMIDHIEVIRGPAAARYGSGAMGGVVNIITKQANKEWHGSWNAYYNVPQHKSEGSTKRTNFSLMGPATDSLTLSIWGNIDKTQADAYDINQSHSAPRVGPLYKGSFPAGREGVRDKDLHGKLNWEFAPNQHLEFEAGTSRQGNIYAGDTQNTNTTDYVKSKYGDETNRIYRQDYALTWTGVWDNGVSTNTYAQYERTRNSRITEGLAGGGEGRFNDNAGFSDIDLSDVLLHSEVSIPFTAWVDQNLTLGTEWNQQKMKDGTSTGQALTGSNTGGAISGVGTSTRSPYSQAQIFSMFAEDNMDITDSTVLTPAIRFDHHSIVGTNWSPSLNLTQQLTNEWTLKMGIARAYKAPNLYQTNPNYILYSKGQGCYGSSSSGCYLQGNRDLKAETSVNKEIGLEYKDLAGLQAGLTYFRNDYHNKIESGNDVTSTNSSGTRVFQWENVPRAVVEGLEGTFNVPVTDTVTWNNNMTWMLQSKDKTNHDRLSVIPQFTLNSNVEWQIRQDLSVQATWTWYGKQKPKSRNYQGDKVSYPDTREVSPYSIFGASATWDATKNVSVTAGIDNLFDKRHFREGNAQTTQTINPKGEYSALYGAGANTYNESGRTFYMSLNTHF
ncbi:TonB-dependent siderophore receptor [Tatumella ptyseos]|uniref:TonB-dependent siderophore receptor n=1 Tax=Tatumella ptyseos TaxID=82987 RepID=UPI0026F0B1FC|nr:TonB-dependent siderophore receptor [Tatumella ptyseos]WKX26228.1 TonB-dependent siderophore receptor [Tatumella ptyseos]